MIPAAGLGTRFLPATKSQPKEMLPIVDKPSIQYAVEEAAAAGITDVIVVTAHGKKAIEEHFAPDAELEQQLEAKQKLDVLAQVRAVPELATMHYALQGEPLGLGHAVAVARDDVGGESFVVMLPDDVMVDDAALLRRMLETHAEHGGVVLALLEVSPDQISAYGCASVEPVADGVMRVLAVVEKPKPEDAASNLAVVGRYVLPPEIFDALERTTPGVGGEIQLTDAIGILIGEQPVHGVVFSEGRYDTGTPLGYLEANLGVALARPDLAEDVHAILDAVVARRGA